MFSNAMFKVSLKSHLAVWGPNLTADKIKILGELVKLWLIGDQKKSEVFYQV